MADPISGGSRPIQSTGIDQTQKTRDSENVKAGSVAPYVQAQQQQQAQQISLSRADLGDKVTQLQELLDQAKAQGPEKEQGKEQSRPPHGFKGVMAKVAHALNKQHGLMSLFGKHLDHHGGLSAMPGLEQSLTHMMSRLKAARVLSGQAPAGKTPLEAPALRPKELSPEEMGLEAAQNPVLAPGGDAPLESPQPRSEDLEAVGLKPVLAPADNAALYAPRTLQEQVTRMTPDQIKAALNQADMTADMQSYLQAQLKHDEDPAVKEYIQAQEGRAQLLRADVSIDDPAFQDLSARIKELKEKCPEQPKPEDFGIDGQKPDPALAGNVRPQPEDSKIDGQNPSQVLPDIAPSESPPPSSPDAPTPQEDIDKAREQIEKMLADQQTDLPPALQGPSDDPAVKDIQQAMKDFQQEWGDYSLKDNPDGKDAYNDAVTDLSKLIAQYYSSVSSEYRS